MIGVRANNVISIKQMSTVPPASVVDRFIFDYACAIWENVNYTIIIYLISIIAYNNNNLY